MALLAVKASKKVEAIIKVEDFGKKLLIGAARLLAVVLPVIFGLLHATPTEATSQDQSTVAATHVYSVASIRPNKSDHNLIRLMYSSDGLSGLNVSLQLLTRCQFQCALPLDAHSRRRLVSS